MKYKVIVTETAALELEEAYEWLSMHTELHAPTWYNGLLDAILSLQSMPGRYPLSRYAEEGDRELRQMVHGDRQDAYLILFEIREEIVFVWHIRHGARSDLEDI